MSITARYLFYRAFRLAGLVSTAQAGLMVDEEEEVRQIYNGMVDSFQSDGLTVAHVARTVFDLVANQEEYTIGPGGDFDTAVWPNKINAAGLILVGQTTQPEYVLHPMTDQDWQEFILKGQASTFPRHFYYERAYPLGKVHFFYISSAANQVALYLEEALSQISIPTGGQTYADTALEYRPGYEEMIVYNLAKRLVESYPDKAKPFPTTLSTATKLYQDLQAVNAKPLARASDATPAGGRRANIYNGNRYGW